MRACLHECVCARCLVYCLLMFLGLPVRACIRCGGYVYSDTICGTKALTPSPPFLYPPTPTTPLSLPPPLPTHSPAFCHIPPSFPPTFSPFLHPLLHSFHFSILPFFLPFFCFSKHLIILNDLKQQERTYGGRKRRKGLG